MNEQTEACRKCGRPLQADFERCPYCGAKRTVGGNHVLRNSIAGVGLVVATLLIVLAVSPSFRGDILSAFHKTAASASAAVSAEVPAATATATLSPTLSPTKTLPTQSPTPQPENAGEYGLRASITYDEFIKEYNSELQDAQNSASAVEVIQAISPDTSMNGRTTRSETTVRHQICENVALSMDVVGQKAFIKNITLAAERLKNTDENLNKNKAVMFAIVSLLRLTPDRQSLYDDKDVQDALTKIFKWKDMGFVEKKLTWGTCTMRMMGNTVIIKMDMR